MIKALLTVVEVLKVFPVGRDTKHVEWVRGYLGLLTQLQKYVLEYHTTGLAWNAKV